MFPQDRKNGFFYTRNLYLNIEKCPLRVAVQEPFQTRNLYLVRPLRMAEPWQNPILPAPQNFIVGRASDRQPANLSVVKHHQAAIARAADVKLESVATGVQCEIKCGECILWKIGQAGTAVAEQQLSRGQSRGWACRCR